MVLMIDNYDSFTYNIVQYCKELGANLKVVRNDELTIKEIEQLDPKKIILSPGPASPNEAGITLDVIKHFGAHLAIFGICLGHQSIAQAYGARIIRAKNMMHGKTSQIVVDRPMPIFNTLPSAFRATRYHSLVVDPSSIDDRIEICAWSSDDKEIMALRVKDRDIYGVLFHPESIMSEYGLEMLDNFLKL